MCRVLVHTSATHIRGCIYGSDGDIPDGQAIVVKSSEYTLPGSELFPAETSLIELSIPQTSLAKGLYWVGMQVQETLRQSDRAILMIDFREFVNTYGDFPDVCPETSTIQHGFAAILKGT